jgi:hypothetical protein
MRLYKNIAVDFTIQNFGTAWLGILRGKTEDIEIVFNGFFNFCATSGKLEYKDHCQTIATFWTNKRKMKRYFYNRQYISQFDPFNRHEAAKTARSARRWAIEQMAIVTESQELLLTITRKVSLRLIPAVLSVPKSPI